MFVRTLTVLGFGELGRCVARAARQNDVPTHAWLRARVSGPDEATAVADTLGVRLHHELADALVPAALVISCVPGSASLGVAQDAARHLRPGTLFVDAASASPRTKQLAAERVSAADADYVDAAVLGSIGALGPQAPWIAAGEAAHRFQDLAGELGLQVTTLQAPVGMAATVKLIRSVYLKGRDALVTEMAMAAHAHGVLLEVVSSIGGPAEQVDFSSLAQRVLRSTAQHSARRAEELEAVADVLEAVGVEPLAVGGALERLRSLSAVSFGRNAPDAPSQPAGLLTALADELGRAGPGTPQPRSADVLGDQAGS